MTDYEVRPFRPADREPYLDLYETVFGARPSAEWFEWKYGTGNPYVDEPPIFVAERTGGGVGAEERAGDGDGAGGYPDGAGGHPDGDLVGARSFFALRTATGEATRLALQPSDAMVHPDHRRRGLFTETTTAALAHFADREPAFCFNFPNSRSLPGNLKLGWAVVDDLTTYYRVHDPAALAEAVPSPLAPLLRAAARIYNRFRTPTPPGGVDVTVHRRDVPAGTLAAIDRRARDDDRLHARRDETFYGWRFDKPGRAYETYVAERGGEPTAALVVGRDDRCGVPTARVLDAPAVGAPADRREARGALLAAMLDDHGDVALVAVRGGLPPALLRRHGFLPDTSLPLSPVTSTSTMVARPLGDADWTVDGRDLRDPDSWRLTFAELDSA